MLGHQTPARRERLGGCRRQYPVVEVADGEDGSAGVGCNGNGGSIIRATPAGDEAGRTQDFPAVGVGDDKWKAAITYRRPFDPSTGALPAPDCVRWLFICISH